MGWQTTFASKCRWSTIQSSEMGGFVEVSNSYVQLAKFCKSDDDWHLNPFSLLIPRQTFGTQDSMR